ncbi:MAG: ribbon-helix-helix domain-containing protein [Xenococcus sp. (in: cyanobacteria)]
MATKKIAITLDPEILKQTDELVTQGFFASRSQAIQIALKETLKKHRLQRLAQEAAKLKDTEEDWLPEETENWLEKY